RTDQTEIKVMPYSKVLIVLPALLPLLFLLPAVSGFGNEYVHIKVHVPKDQAPSIAVDAPEPVSPHKVIHHFHHHAPPPSSSHHQRLRGRAKLKTSPLLESVILSDLDKPLHMSEHADYLNHAKELAEHLSETYVVKKAPPPPKKKINTYTIIEEKHRANGYDYEPRPQHDVDTYRVIDSRPQHQFHKHHHQHPDEDDDDVGYHYPSPGRVHRHKAPFSSGAYAEPAPVEEPLDLDQGYNYAPPSLSYATAKSARAPAHTLEAPEESPLDAQYQFDYGSNGGFRPSPQLHTQSDIYEDDLEPYAGPVPTRRRRPSSLDWASRSVSGSSYNIGGIDSYNVAHVQGLGSSGYPHAGPYL
ncbi:hypothetical protein KR093_002840, partial [Drosophila rubida]